MMGGPTKVIICDERTGTPLREETIPPPDANSPNAYHIYVHVETPEPRGRSGSGSGCWGAVALFFIIVSLGAVIKWL